MSSENEKDYYGGGQFWRRNPVSVPARPVKVKLTKEESNKGSNDILVEDCLTIKSDNIEIPSNNPLLNPFTNQPDKVQDTLSPSTSSTVCSSTSTSTSSTSFITNREGRFESILNSAVINVGTDNLFKKGNFTTRMKDLLRKVSWKGIPNHQRPIVWKILIGYLPNIVDRHKSTLQKKHSEYKEIISQHFGVDSRRDPSIMHQITIDVPRTAPDIPLFRNEIVRESLVRILYCWSIRRPASGYVQGINDLVTPFYDVFFSEYIHKYLDYEKSTAGGSPDGESLDKSFDTKLDKDLDGKLDKELDKELGSKLDKNLDRDLKKDLHKESSTRTITLPESVLFKVEADTFWCFCKLLDGIQDNYTFNQAGISRQLLCMENILKRTDPKLIAHFESQGVTLLQFAFRWINCMLLREFPLFMIERMWDTYLAEGENGFSDFHIYVCAAFLTKWSDRLQILDFQDIILFLQNPPTITWSLSDLEILLSEAYVWKVVFEDSSSSSTSKHQDNKSLSL